PDLLFALGGRSMLTNLARFVLAGWHGKQERVIDCSPGSAVNSMCRQGDIDNAIRHKCGSDFVKDEGCMRQLIGSAATFSGRASGFSAMTAPIALPDGRGPHRLSHLWRVCVGSKTGGDQATKLGHHMDGRARDHRR